MPRKKYVPTAASVQSKIRRQRWIWADTILGTFAGMRIRPEERTRDSYGIYEAEEGDDIYLHIPTRNDSYITLELTKLTALELDYVEAVFARVIAAARPIVKERDQIAEDAKHAGDDSYARVYRQVPVLIIREGSQ